MPLRKVHELAFLWFGLPGRLLIQVGGGLETGVGEGGGWRGVGGRVGGEFGFL